MSACHVWMKVLTILLLATEPIALLIFIGGSFSPGRLLCAYATFWISLGLSITAYRLSPFHPLAEFPGPAVDKVTKLRGLWIASLGHQHRSFKKLHDKYGSYVRTGPNEISIIDVAAVTQILNTGGLDKGRSYESGRHSSIPPTIISLSGEAHTAKRRVWNRSMTSAALREYDTLIMNRASQLVSRLGDQDGRIDLVAWFDFFTLDLMDSVGDLKPFAMAKTASTIGSHIPWIIPTLHLFPHVGRIIQEFNDFGRGLAVRRIKQGAVHTKDLWYHLADEAGLEKEKPTLESSAADGIVAIVAASDTTASTLSSLMWFLMSNPELYQRVQVELDGVYPEGADPLDVSQHDQLVFLSACINETLRLHPPVPSIGTRCVPLNSSGRNIAGRFLPRGTSVYTPPYSLHRNPDYFFPHPDHFVPDRWLPGSNFEKHATSAFIPFSLGPANCVGQKLAKREILVAISILLKSFSLRFADGFDSEAWPGHIQDFFISTRGSLQVNLTRRHDHV
ncbi:cytochrome P450 [Mycena maculata]|uniref:Cytochrome P450 n=1 Tax=Mycena maculata TaxID=230809 RepID=A0AAD7N621_9AGAR|nr:cytochrome P450 [Mycena maculata]